MSAIAGVYLLNGDSVDEKDLKRMNDSMPHRGPDGSGLWHDGPVGLAHQMLWTTPESLHETLPFEANGLVITSDSRIDNREELLPELGLSEEVSDSEVILKAYGRWGKSCVDRLLGDFAFAIWDKAKEELFCARDHMGFKPFYYYYRSNRIFAFATEIKALFAWGVPQNINEVAIGDYLVRNTEDREITFYTSIMRLTSANFLIINSEGLHKETYWMLDLNTETRMSSDKEYEKAFRDIFKEAVKCRLRSAFPIGSELSGGLDSSSIVCMANELLPKGRSLKTFSIIFDTIKECDERQYINMVLKLCDIEAHYIYGDKIGPLNDAEKMLWHEDQPFLVFNLFLKWALYKEARSHNIRVLLNGVDGDTTVSHGFAYITELASNGKLAQVLGEVMGVSRNLHAPSKRVFFRFCVFPFIPNYLCKLWRLLHGREDPFLADFKIVNSEFADQINLLDRKKIMNRPRSSNRGKEDHWLGLTSGINEATFEIADKAAGALSIEQRSPFFDKRLVEFCLSLPGDQKIRKGWTRWIMRSALRDMLPEKICYRGGKSDLSNNFLYGILTFHGDAIENLTSEIYELDKYINSNEFNKYYKKLASTNAKSKGDAMNIWQAVILSLWLKSMKA